MTAAVHVHGRDRETVPTLTVTFAFDSVVVSGTGRGHQFVVFGIGIASHGGYPLLTRDVLTPTDADGDGVVTVKPRRLPAESVWIAVDVEDGSYGVGSPGGTLPKRLAVGDEQLQGGRSDIDVPSSYLEVLLVRPRNGAWTLRTADGGSRDADRKHDGVLKLRLAAMERLIGDSGGPPVSIPKDVLVVVDPHKLHYFVGAAR